MPLRGGGFELEPGAAPTTGEGALAPSSAFQRRVLRAFRATLKKGIQPLMRTDGHQCIQATGGRHECLSVFMSDLVSAAFALYPWLPNNTPAACSTVCHLNA